LDRALDARYSCIILDVMLPGRNGFDVVTELRSRSVFTPVLMLTAKDELDRA
jgi:DNA-binding response OmpR family regulator